MDALDGHHSRHHPSLFAILERFAIYEVNSAFTLRCFKVRCQFL